MRVFQKLDRLADLSYGIYLPPGHNQETEKSWPILCYLHGRRECGRPSDTKEEREAFLTSHGPLKVGSSQSATNDFIVVVPQMPCLPGGGIRSFSNNWKDYADIVKQIATTVQEQYRGDLQRIYLTGFSYGGNGVLDIAIADADAKKRLNFWAALWPVDPTRSYGKIPQLPIWLWYGNNNLQPNQDTVKKLGLQCAPVNGIPAGDSLCTNTGLLHVPTATAAYEKDGVYAWLREKKVSGTIP